MAMPCDASKLTSEAIDLANAAVYFDKNDNIPCAIDYYDKAILNIDEVLGKLKPLSSEWKILFNIRGQYDERIELLREVIAPKYDFSSMGLNSSEPKKKITTSKRLPFEEIESILEQKISKDQEIEDPPSEDVLLPFWLLRLFRRTIDNGCFITSSIFVPRIIWTQSNIKFSGLTTKTQAYQHILGLISEHLLPLQMSIDKDSVEHLHSAFRSFADSMIALQNQLSKPFPFIKEIISSSDELSSSPPKSKWSSMMSNFSKNVMKYAEVGYQRLGTISVRVSDEDFAGFVALTSELCSQCQIIEKWYKFVAEHMSFFIHEYPEIKSEELLQDIIAISSKLRDIVCEIILRDIEYLVERHLNKMRKSFARMYWDDDDSSSVGSEIA